MSSALTSKMRSTWSMVLLTFSALVLACVSSSSMSTGMSLADSSKESNVSVMSAKAWCVCSTASPPEYVRLTAVSWSVRMRFKAHHDWCARSHSRRRRSSMSYFPTKQMSVRTERRAATCISVRIPSGLPKFNTNAGTQKISTCSTQNVRT